MKIVLTVWCLNHLHESLHRQIHRKKWIINPSVQYSKFYTKNRLSVLSLYGQCHNTVLKYISLDPYASSSLFKWCLLLCTSVTRWNSTHTTICSSLQFPYDLICSFLLLWSFQVKRCCENSLFGKSLTQLLPLLTVDTS